MWPVSLFFLKNIYMCVCVCVYSYICMYGCELCTGDEAYLFVEWKFSTGSKCLQYIQGVYTWPMNFSSEVRVPFKLEVADRLIYLLIYIDVFDCQILFQLRLIEFHIISKWLICLTLFIHLYSCFSINDFMLIYFSVFVSLLKSWPFEMNWYSISINLPWSIDLILCQSYLV